jgi:hypothetical protein
MAPRKHKASNDDGGSTDRVDAANPESLVELKLVKEASRSDRNPTLKRAAATTLNFVTTVPVCISRSCNDDIRSNSIFVVRQG